MAQAKAAGRAGSWHWVAMADGQIAATAAARGLMVATRDAGPFTAAGLRVIDPWESA